MHVSLLTGHLWGHGAGALVGISSTWNIFSRLCVMTDTASIYLPNVTKFGAFLDYLEKHWRFIFAGYSSQDSQQVDFMFTHPITDDELQSFTTVVQAWKDPPFWLQLSRVEECALYTNRTTGNELTTSHTFIVSPNTPDDSVLDSMKSVVLYETDAVETYASIPANTPCTLSVCVYDVSRDMPIRHATFDVSCILSAWKAAAASGAVGKHSIYKTFQVYDLLGTLPDHDCIWQFKIAIDAPGVYISLHGLQKLLNWKQNT